MKMATSKSLVAVAPQNIWKLTAVRMGIARFGGSRIMATNQNTVLLLASSYSGGRQIDMPLFRRIVHPKNRIIMSDRVRALLVEFGLESQLPMVNPVSAPAKKPAPRKAGGRRPVSKKS